MDEQTKPTDRELAIRLLADGQTSLEGLAELVGDVEPMRTRINRLRIQLENLGSELEGILDG